MGPDWEELETFFASVRFACVALPLHRSRALAQDARISVDNVDCTIHREVCEQNGVQGYPTLKAFHMGKELAGFSGPRDLPGFKSWAIESIKASSQ
jgi:thioredoxin-like negative regulator of GroEL